jgi:hypothetical protein
MTKRNAALVLLGCLVAASMGLALWRRADDRPKPSFSPVGVWVLDHVEAQMGSHPIPPRGWTIEIAKGGKFIETWEFPRETLVSQGTWSIKGSKVALVFKTTTVVNATGKTVGHVPTASRELAVEGSHLTTDWFDKYVFRRKTPSR